MQHGHSVTLGLRKQLACGHRDPAERAGSYIAIKGFHRPGADLKSLLPPAAQIETRGRCSVITDAQTCEPPCRSSPWATSAGEAPLGGTEPPVHKVCAVIVWSSWANAGDTCELHQAAGSLLRACSNGT